MTSTFGSITKRVEVENSKLANTPSIVVKVYDGRQGEATALLKADCIEMAAEGYFPTWQDWSPGEWTREAYIIAVSLIFLFGMGLLVLAYLLVVEPEGRLTVAYERRAAPR